MREEIIQLCDLRGNPCGSSPRGICHKDPSLIQMVVHLLIFNSNKDIFLQKRGPAKDVYPGRWDTSVGGHVGAGENVKKAMAREAKEELGINIKPDEPQFLFKQLYTTEFESEMSFVFKLTYNGPFYIDNFEVTEGRFFTPEEIRGKLGKEFFTPNFEDEFLTLQS
ncbi:MAG: NUDIX domain-containing protein [Spirochaetia bacterium]|jgi:isopentenyldiphosphate isomerase|nr:NUDIX domain-containing protein [Spirochaetia bacterium]